VSPILTATALAEALDCGDLSFRVQAISLRRGATEYPTAWLDGHDKAIDIAVELRDRLGDVIDQVTITATVHPFSHDTFAVRHLTARGDSGWSVWRDGQHVKTGVGA